MPTRSEAVAIGFLILWMTVWTAAILVTLWSLGAAALSGEPGPVVFLALWLAAAGFGLATAARRLRQRLLGETRPRRPHRNHQWRDGIDPPGPAA